MEIQQCSYKNIYIVERIITGLEIITGPLPENLENSLIQEEWVDLDGCQNLWLRLFYNQKNSPAITHMHFAYMHFEKEDVLVRKMRKKKMKIAEYDIYRYIKEFF
jgi:hypothetical protein